MIFRREHLPEPEGTEALNIIQRLYQLGMLPKLRAFELKGSKDEYGDCMDITPWVTADLWIAASHGVLALEPWTAIIGHDRQGNPNTWLEFAQKVVVDFTPASRGIVVIMSRRYRTRVLDKIGKTSRFRITTAAELKAYHRAIFGMSERAPSRTPDAAPWRRGP